MEEHIEKDRIGGRTITNLQFAHDTDALAEEEKETLDKAACTRYKMEISAEKTKLLGVCNCGYVPLGNLGNIVMKIETTAKRPN